MNLTNTTDFQNEIENIREKINVYLNEIPKHNNAKDPLETYVENSESNEQNYDDSITVSRTTQDRLSVEERMLKRERERKWSQRRKRGLAGYIRSRKLKRKLQNSTKSSVLNPASINMMENCAISIPRVEIPYKKYRNEMFEIMSQNEILESRTRVNRRASQPFNYKLLSAQPQSAPKIKKPPLPECDVNKESKIDQKMADVKVKIKSQSPNIENMQSVQPRQRRRINYSDEWVDEALMYEQILQDKQNQEDKSKKNIPKKMLQQRTNELNKSITSPANLDSRLRLLEQRNEISITPLKSRLITKESNKIESKLSMPLKSEPLFNITSSVSVHIKPRSKEQTSANLQISNITSLHSPQPTPPNKRRKLSCAYCAKTFADEKQLAIHQIIHLKIAIHKIGTVKTLNPKLRRVSIMSNTYY